MNFNSEEYIKGATTTESKDFSGMQERFSHEDNMRLMHAAIGISTEAGELLDAMKKHIYYGKELDKVNLKEEMGDLFWYMAIMADVLDIPFETIMQNNLDKLKARYGDKFSAEKAINRDLSVEREILEEI